MNEESIATILHVLSFCKAREKCGCEVQNVGYSSEVRLKSWHITLVHIHAMFEHDLLNTSSVANRILKGGCYIKTYHMFGPK